MANSGCSPNRRWCGENWVDECFEALYADTTSGKISSHGLLSSTLLVAIRFLMICTALSALPLPWALYGTDVLRCTAPDLSFFGRLPCTKFEPLSVTTTCG